MLYGSRLENRCFRPDRIQGMKGFTKVDEAQVNKRPRNDISWLLIITGNLNLKQYTSPRVQSLDSALAKEPPPSSECLLQLKKRQEERESLMLNRLKD